MKRRLPSHIAVVALLVLSAIDLDLITDASAAPEPSRTPAPIATNPLPRGEPGRDPIATPIPIPTQSPPSPLPTPVAIDLSATPLPGPTEPPPQSAPGVYAAALTWPLAGSITTAYSAAHPAVDIAATCGTPVLAPMSGTITFAGWRNNGGGYVIEISGWAVTSLNHLSGFALTAGPVVAGQLVGYVGATGMAIGCHVHLNLLVDGVWQNPLIYLP